MAMVLLSQIISLLHAGPIRGIVKDKTSGESLIGSVVRVKNQVELSTTTGLDGTFHLKNLPDDGTVTIVVTYIGYKPQEISVDLRRSTPITVELESDERVLNEVMVTGMLNRRTDQSAIAMVRESSQVLNVMSQQALQLSPDVNVASALQRVSGVTMEKDAAGEAAYAVLRGMDKRYNYTLVNSIKIPSPDDKNRYIPLNLFPSDLMDRLVVSKSLTADMEGDAAGGVVDMQMKDAPGQLMLQAHAAVGASDFFMGDRDYLTTDRGNTTAKAPYERMGSEYKATMQDFKSGAAQVSRHAMPAPNILAGLAAGNRFLNKRLGLLVAGSLQNIYRGSERTLNTPTMPFGEQAEVISKMQSRDYSFHDLTVGLHAKADLTLGNHKFEWYNMLMHKKEDGVRYSQVITTDFGYEPEKGLYTRDDEIRSNTQTQTIFATHLKGTHKFGQQFTVDWSGVFSEAREKDPDRAYIEIKNSFLDNQLTKTVASAMERRFQHNNDRDWAGYINASYATPFSFADATWKAGAMYRKKKRENRYYSYQFNPLDISATLDGNGYEVFDGIEWYCRTPYAQASQLNYNSKEHIGAVYGMMQLANSWGELVAGVRAEHTNQIYTMLQQFRGMGSVGEQSYWDWLPSASLKWKMNRQMNARLSYYKSINRPGFYEIVPYQIIGEDYIEKGNPDLRRARIDNIDLRWEWFPSANEQLLVGVFYKYLKDPIEMTFATDNRQTNNSFYMPQNLGNAKNFGVEVDVIKYIRHFGLKANYTYTHSAITTSKRQFKPGSSDVELAKQTRPLVNQAPHTANLSLLYKDTEHGWNFQLASAYTGNQIVLVSPFKDADEWERHLISIDLSGEKQFKGGWSIFFKANNLTDAKREHYLKTVNDYNFQFPGQRTDRTITRTYKFGRTFLIGARFTL